MIRLFVTTCLLAVTLSLGSIIYIRHCSWNPEIAAQSATQNAESKSQGMCALYVRKAIIEGGIPLYVGSDAWTYKYVLPFLNFKEVKNSNNLQIGDIVVFQPIGNRKFGHVAMWNGKQWVSDFKQRSMIVHSDYLNNKCIYNIYRRV